MKKIILKIGTIGAIAAPIAASISCANAQETIDTGNWTYFESPYNEIQSNLDSKVSPKVFVDVEGNYLNQDASKYINKGTVTTNLSKETVFVGYSYMTWEYYINNFDNIYKLFDKRYEAIEKEFEKIVPKKYDYELNILLINDVAIELEGSELSKVFLEKTNRDKTKTYSKDQITEIYNKLKSLL